MVYVLNDNQFTNRTRCIIDGTKVTTETNIPLMLNLVCVGVKANGADIRIGWLNKSTGLIEEIAREIEWHWSATDNVALFYKLDTTASTNETIFVYWGNSALSEPAASSTYGSEAVWDSNYVGVWHMNQDPSGSAPQIKDSTSNANHGTSNGSMTSGDLVDTSYGKGIDFDGSNDFISIPNSSELQIAGSFTLQGLYNPDSLPAIDKWSAIVSKGGLGDGAGTDHNYATVVQNDIFVDGQAFGTLYENSVGTNNIAFHSTSYSTGVEHITSTIHDSVANTLKFYSDGALRATNSSATDTPTTNTEPVTIAAPIDTIGGIAVTLDGIIPEVRISNIARTENYILTIDNNLYNPTADGADQFYISISEDRKRASPIII